MYNKKVLNILMLGLLLILPVSCSQDENQQTIGIYNLDDVVSFTVSSGQPTRSFTTFDNYWTADQPVSVCEGSTVYTYKASETSSASGGQVPLVPNVNGREYWNASNTFFWSTLVTSRTFFAWYPHAASQPSEVSVPADQTTASLTDAQYNAYDILYAPAVTVGFKQTVDLTFYHQLCRIVVTVNSAATKKSKPVTEIKLGKGNISKAGTITTLGSTGSGAPGTKTVWNVPSAKETITMRLQSANDNTHIYTYECIVPPQDLTASSVLFQIKTEKTGVATKVTDYIPADLFQDAPSFVAGHQYNYNITLSASGLVNISTVQVYDWTNESVTGLNADVPDAGY